MKKTLVALAALAATSAFAQTSVTLYGTLDASIQNVTRMGSPTTGPVLKNGTVYVDSAVASSVWGLRGSEDLGGGLRANFNAEGDLATNNGGTHQAGMFRRQLNVSLVSAKMGELALGLKTNPFIGAAGGMVPVGGNTVTTNLAGTLGYADFFTRNAVTYVSPSMGGLVAQLQHGLSNNQSDSSSYGSMTAFSAVYRNGPLTLRAAAQSRQESNNPASSANAGATNSGNKRSQLFGATYAINNQLTVSANRVSTKQAKNSDTATAPIVFGNAYEPQKNASVFGLGYQLNPAVLLGANYIKAEDSNFYNFQARYALSKRTTTYAQLSTARNDANGRANFAPVQTNSGNSPAANVQGLGGVAGKNQSAFGVGIIHTF